MHLAMLRWSEPELLQPKYGPSIDPPKKRIDRLVRDTDKQVKRVDETVRSFSELYRDYVARVNSHNEAVREYDRSKQTQRTPKCPLAEHDLYIVDWQPETFLHESARERPKFGAREQ